MGFILSLIVGAILGWIAALMVHGGNQRRIRHDIIIGPIGALFGAFFLGPVLGGGNLLESRLDVRTLLVAVIGAITALLAVTLVRRRRAS